MVLQIFCSVYLYFYTSGRPQQFPRVCHLSDPAGAVTTDLLHLQERADVAGPSGRAQDGSAGRHRPPRERHHEEGGEDDDITSDTHAVLN